jgi:TIGR03009 family protein
MRRFSSALCALVVAPALMTAQQPAGVDPNFAKMQQVLAQWEQAMNAMNSVETDCTRTTIKRAFKSVEKYNGKAKFLKSNIPNQSCRASLELYKEGRQEVFDKIICTGTFIHFYDSSNKVIKIYDQPQGQGQLNDNNFLDFLFGMKAGEAIKRYEIVYMPPTDKWYHYLRILPKTEKDKQAFKEARVALNVSNFLPRQLLFVQPNDDEVTWDFPRMTPNAVVQPQDFVVPEPPTGWQRKRILPEK